MITRLAVRNLSRNAWRSSLTVGGVAVAVALLIWMIAFLGGWMDAMVRAITAIDTLQVKIERQDYVDDAAIYHSFPFDEGLVETLEARPEVVAATGRVKLYGLIGNEERSQVARIFGVDPVREVKATPIGEAITRGKWLSGQARAEQADDEAPAPGELVLGEGLARQLRVDVGDELVAFLEAADGSLGNELFIVTGILRTGNSAIDRQAAYISLADAQQLAALDGHVHEIALQTADLAKAREVSTAIAALIDAAGFDEPMSVRSWQAIVPQISEMIEMSKGSMGAMYFIIYLVASLGVMNTQRMSALERRREFAVMMAIGVTPGRLFRIILA
jgi:ABC-type lipoprotein release transport system permease subunit